MNCKSCKTKTLPVYSLGQMPLANSFLKKEKIKNEKKYDLGISFCPQCFLVQLTNAIAPGKLFTNYIYFSSISASFRKHCEKTANYFKKRFKLTKNSLVLEIASNDGAQLSCFNKLGIKTLGIDPAKNIAKIASKKGVATIPEFFNLALAQKLTNKKNIYADIIFGANVLAHIPQIINFLKGIKIILKPGGTASFEFPYLKCILNGEFDTIYHEHVFYFSLLALTGLFEKVGLTIYDAQFTLTQGRSLRIFASHAGKFPVSENIKKILDRELRDGFDKIDTFNKIKNNTEKLKADTLALLAKLKKQGKSIAAYSAPAKGNILLNFFGISGSNYLDYIVDKETAKQGLYTPGTHMLVYPPQKIYEAKPDYLIILCRNIADEIINEFKEYQKNGGKFIILIPKLKII